MDFKKSRQNQFEGYALEFHKTHYEVYGVPFMGDSGYGFLCITFRTKNDGDQSLVSNDPGNPSLPVDDIMVSGNSIFIIGFDRKKKQVSIPIQHDCRKWTTLFVDWMVKFTKAGVSLTGSYMIDGDKKLVGTFNFTKERSYLQSRNTWLLGDIRF